MTHSGSHKGTIPYGGITVYIGKASLELNIQQWQHNILATYQLTKVSCIHFGNIGHPVA